MQKPRSDVAPGAALDVFRKGLAASQTAKSTCGECSWPGDKSGENCEDKTATSKAFS